MSVRVHWESPILETNFGSTTVDDPDRDCDGDLVSSHDPENLENESKHSHVASSESSTNATKTDLIGPGRTIGLFYDRAGRRLEVGLSKLARKLRSRYNAESRLPQGTFADVQVSSSNSQGSWDRRRLGTSTTNSSRTSSSIFRAFSFSTVSSDETATNIPGPGRVIGNLYTAGGRMLESRMNKLAANAGRGPDACAERIRKAIIGEPYLDEVLMYLYVKAREKRKAKGLLEHEQILFRECKQLLRYAESRVPSTHNRAMQLISELAVEDRYVRTLFNALEAPRILEEVRNREMKIHNVDSDWFIPYCRKAVVCLSNNEVNITLFRHLRMAENPQDLPLPLVYYTLEKYLNDPEQSFLAVRYLRRMIKRWRLLAFPFDVASDCIARLADLAYSLPHIIEWDCMDDIFRTSLQACLSYIDIHGEMADYNTIKWNKVLVSSLSHAHRLPSTIEFITERTDVNTLLDPTNRSNQWSTKHADTDTLILPDGSGFGRQYIRAVASLPKLLLGTQDLSSLAPSGDHQGHSLTVSKYDNFSAFCNMYRHEELERIRKNLSVGPDVLTSEIFSLRDTDWHSHRGRADGVPREPALSFLCRKLTSFLTSSDSEEVLKTIQRMKLVLQLDRYCRRAMVRAIQRVVSESGNLPTNGSLELFTVPDLPDIGSLEELVPRRWMYRHRTADGAIHVRNSPPYSEKEPCTICVEKKIWEHAIVSDPSEVFCGSQQLILVLEVQKEETFNSSGHRPILAGINGAGQKEYIAVVMYANEARAGPTNIRFHAFTTVTEGAAAVDYLDENGVHSTDHFWVFVLRYDTDESVEQKLAEKDMFDITGHCYWMPDRPTTVVNLK